MKNIEYRLIDFGSELSVASISISPEEAKENAAAVIQEAVDHCAESGGGVVYLASGEYYLDQPISISTSVFLCGCGDPTKFAEEKTVLCCRYGKDAPELEPQISMSACTGIKNLVFYYPEQSISAPVAYPATVRQNGLDSITLENIVMINPWRGIQCGPDANELHFIKNVYMTPLDIGFYIDMTTDIGRIQGLHITPECYAEYVDGADINSVREYMLSNTIGLFMGRSDWEYIYDYSAEDCAVGIKITAVQDSGPNAQLSGVRLHNCNIGIELIDVNPYGIALSDSIIGCDRSGLEAALKTNSSFGTIMQLSGVDFEGCGGYKTVISHDGSGQLSFADCSFRECGVDKYAVSCTNGGVSFIQCSFSGGGTDFSFGREIKGAQIINCYFERYGESRSPEILYDGILTVAEEIGNLKYSSEELKLPKASRGGYKPYPYYVGPQQKKLFLAYEYGADPSGEKDSSTAIQAALDAAAADGGGIVYLAGGKYLCNVQLIIPSGVELRGTAEMPCHTMGGGSVIMTDYGRGFEDAEPFIILEERAGLRGVLLYNPGQDAADPTEYPFAVQSRGKYCYVINTVFVNMWQALDMASYPSEGHYVSYVSGAPFKVGIYFGSNDGEGWVENVQFNPHYWFRSNLPNVPHSDNWHAFWFNQMKYLEALKFGYNNCEHLLGTFVFAARHGIGFVRQNGKGTSGKFIGHGTDSGLVALYLGGAEQIELINTQLVNIQADGRRMYIYSEAETHCGDIGEYRIYNTLMWGDPHYAAVFDGGKIMIKLMNIVAAGRQAVTVNGGEIRLCGVYFRKAPAKCVINGGKTEFIAQISSNGEAELDITWNDGEYFHKI